MEAELQKKLLNRAGKLLAKRPYSCGEMRIKLSKLAESADVENILNRLEALNLLNDADYAYDFAFSRIRLQGWGPIRVRHSLLHRQVAHQIIETALDRVWQDVGDRVVLREYIDQHYRKTGIPQDRKGIKRLIAHLQRRGFADATIYSTLREMIPDLAWECFETGE